MTTLSSLAQLETTLKTDLLQTIGSPVMTLLSTTSTIAQGVAATATPSAAQIAVAIAQENAAWMVFLANGLGSMPNLAAEGIAALSQFAMSKLQTSIPAVAKS